jgi:hypothetical protein
MATSGLGHGDDGTLLELPHDFPGLNHTTNGTLHMLTALGITLEYDTNFFATSPLGDAATEDEPALVPQLDTPFLGFPGMSWGGAVAAADGEVEDWSKEGWRTVADYERPDIWYETYEQLPHLDSELEKIECPEKRWQERAHKILHVDYPQLFFPVVSTEGPTTVEVSLHSQ